MRSDLCSRKTTPSQGSVVGERGEGVQQLGRSSPKKEDEGRNEGGGSVETERGRGRRGRKQDWLSLGFYPVLNQGH